MSGRPPGERRLRPEPSTFWIGLAPQRWRSDIECWTDLASGALGRSDPLVEPDGWPGEEDVVVYVPPGNAGEEPRPHWLRQVVAGAEPQRSAKTSAWTVVDPLEALLRGELDVFAGVARGVSVVWPLIAGVTDDDDLVDGCLARLRDVGVRHVQPIALTLTPRDRRWLAGRVGEAGWQKLFHGPAPSERSFSRRATRFDLKPFRPRPTVPGGRRVRDNRRVAGWLALVAELWIRCGRGEAEGQALFRAARWAEDTPIDIVSVAREGNLSVVPTLEGRSVEVVGEAAHDAEPSLAAELEAEYLGGRA